MKSTIALLLAWSGGAIAAPTMSDPVTPEEMAQRQQVSPASSIQKAQASTTVEAKVERAGEQSIIQQSDILHDGKNWTLVPKGAVLHVPAQMAPRVGAKPLGTLLSWNEFLAANRAWISTEEISFEQAAGKKPLNEDHKEYWTTQTKVIVATHQGGPISVRPALSEAAVTANK
ncbi:hypothetical protein [Luteolibacter luteus]|jgi:hypothetical protein|uniref:Uncharacterized protein n=1 Tax=Luteolibacter luteus TaxID=2728835 RepID=A0A858RQK1_9BACT|nr:hypothetical protein [Luteolibacter luteus]QJE98629.1 hypothetical protein HHL09_23535 [Luteolibacter luteus]